MKRLLAVLLALLTVVSTVWAAENLLLDRVDLGNPTDADEILSGWGRSAIDETGGNYGGIYPGSCRLVYDPKGGDRTMDALVQVHPLKGSAQYLVIGHLDGLADDSFQVEVEAANGAWIHAGSYPHVDDGIENWIDTTFDLSDTGFGRGREPFRVRITLTGDLWGGVDTWGQLCIDGIDVYGNGAPR